MSILMMMVMMMSLLFIGLMHPMLLAATIIMQTLVLCMMIWLTSSTSWFSYILFLIFLGGIMVLFIYICSLACNEIMSVMISKYFLFLIPLVTFYMMFFMAPQQMMNFELFYKMMSFFLSASTAVSMFYLLVTLIVVVKITNINMGPLRSNKK